MYVHVFIPSIHPSKNLCREIKRCFLEERFACLLRACGQEARGRVEVKIYGVVQVLPWMSSAPSMNMK